MTRKSEGQGPPPVREVRGAPSRIGSVPYLNAAPLVRGLEGKVRLLPPSQLARALAAGEVDAALLSITEPLLRGTYDILDGPCVASDGEVLSVFLAHRRPLAEVDLVHCDTASLTSVNLLRVLLAERDLRPAFVPLSATGKAAEKEFVLLIGDEALAFQRAGHPHAIWDLGGAWKGLTGLPFVYAVWALRRGVETRDLQAVLLSATARGLADLSGVIRDSVGFDEAFRRRYLTQHIRFRLSDAEKRGVDRFAELLERHGLGPVFPAHYVGKDLPIGGSGGWPVTVGT